MNAPAGFSGLGSADVRSAFGGCTGIVVAPTATRLQGTGLPVAARLRPAAEQATAELHTQDKSFQNDGTTLGIPPSRRPLS
jgi:hypothetical protein